MGRGKKTTIWKILEHSVLQVCPQEKWVHQILTGGSLSESNWPGGRGSSSLQLSSSLPCKRRKIPQRAQFKHPVPPKVRGKEWKSTCEFHNSEAQAPWRLRLAYLTAWNTSPPATSPPWWWGPFTTVPFPGALCLGMNIYETYQNAKWTTWKAEQASEPNVARILESSDPEFKTSMITCQGLIK